MLRRFARRSAQLALVACAPAAWLFAGCADTVTVAEGPDTADASAPPSSGGFTSTPEAGAAADAGPEASSKALKMCIASTCEAPWTTCGASYKCGINLSNDNANCGTCGNTCTNVPSLHMESRCENSACQYECNLPEFKNCDGLVENGCEVSVKLDPNNCGTCGNKCAEGSHCIDGQCGCPSGKTDCNGVCVDLLNDPNNCTACGTVCPTYQAMGLPAPPTNMKYTCAAGLCGKLICSGTFRDCDHDQSNGCEINVANDPLNCSTCGNACDPGQQCSITGSSQVPRCLCDSGTFCNTGSNLGCFDLLSDVKNCGACGYTCPGANVPNTTSTCDQGICATQCVPGYADCDGNPSNGCEVNLMVDASNCGACGKWCDTKAGQPCVEGSCLMTECDGGTVQ